MDTLTNPESLATATRLPRVPFLVGSERSGTTLLRVMLSTHREIAWSSEFEFAVDQLHAPQQWPDLQAYREYLSTQMSYILSGYTFHEDCDYPGLVDGFLRERLQKDGKHLVGATVHKHFDRLLWIWPDARFIHLVRDPRDVARSALGMAWGGNVWTSVGIWLEAESLWERLRDQLEADRYLEISYEQLLTDCETTLRKICTFLEVEFDPGMLRYHEMHNMPPLDPRRIHQWRRTCTNDQVRIIEARVGPRLEAAGYAPSGLPPLNVTSFHRNWFAVHSRVAKIPRRIRNLGLKLYLREKWAKSLGGPAARERIRREIVNRNIETVNRPNADRSTSGK